LAASTLTILFVEKLKFSKNSFFKDEYFVKENKSILQKNSNFDMESSKIKYSTNMS
jgi:hypothetical protein